MAEQWPPEEVDNWLYDEYGGIWVAVIENYEEPPEKEDDS